MAGNPGKGTEVTQYFVVSCCLCGFFVTQRLQDESKLTIFENIRLTYQYHGCMNKNVTQDRREMERVRADGGISMPRAMIPSQGRNISRQEVPRTRSMPRNAKPKSQAHSVANGGVAVLDPKKDMRKQTRKMKTAGGAVGGAVMGGLILGPVGVVLGAGAGASVSNKVAKSRDKRKQSEFEQRSFQQGANSSVANKGDGAFV